VIKYTNTTANPRRATHPQDAGTPQIILYLYAWLENRKGFIFSKHFKI
jgi:hypothetical protein